MLIINEVGITIAIDCTCINMVGLRILAKVAIRYVSQYMPRDYDINRDTM